MISNLYPRIHAVNTVELLMAIIKQNNGVYTLPINHLMWDVSLLLLFDDSIVVLMMPFLIILLIIFIPSSLKSIHFSLFTAKKTSLA